MATYIAGYTEDRVNCGEIRSYYYPPDGGLPSLSDDLFPDLGSSFVSALRLKEQEIVIN